VKKSPILALVATSLIALPAAAAPITGALELPDFSHLQSKARESVNVNLDGFLMRIAKAVAAKEENGDEGLKLLQDIKSVQVKSFEFDSDNEYSKADIDAVRKQLASPGWSAIAQVRKREDKENVDVFICTEGEKILGLAVIASGLRSFTIVNVIGSIDIDKLARLEGQFGIPKVNTHE
jgi:Domain of unknown function (DUF4252)